MANLAVETLKESNNTREKRKEVEEEEEKMTFSISSGPSERNTIRYGAGANGFLLGGGARQHHQRVDLPTLGIIYISRANPEYIHRSEHTQTANMCIETETCSRCIWRQRLPCSLLPSVCLLPPGSSLN